MKFYSEILSPLYLLRNVGNEDGVVYDEILIAMHTVEQGYLLATVKAVKTPSEPPDKSFYCYNVCREQNGHGRIGLRIAKEIRVPRVGILLPPDSFETFWPIDACNKHLVTNWIAQLNAETGNQYG